MPPTNPPAAAFPLELTDDDLVAVAQDLFPDLTGFKATAHDVLATNPKGQPVVIGRDQLVRHAADRLAAHVAQARAAAAADA